MNANKEHKMTALEMKNKMVEFIRTHPGATFVELKRLCGEEAAGELTMELKPNWVLWQGVSDVFVAAVELLRQDKRIEVTPATVLMYLIDGVILNLPLVESNRQYKKQHWMPLSFSMKEEQPK